MSRNTVTDADRTASVLAAYDKLTNGDKAAIMDLDKRLEERMKHSPGRMGLGRIGRLEVLAAIGKMTEEVTV